MSISKCKKYISAVPTDSSSFQQSLTDSWSRTPGSRTPGHELLVHRLLVTKGCPRPDGREKKIVWSVVILLKQRNSSSVL
ncbi:hypothetical protein TNCV_253661 [Trichonephila clavipes]|nr:hypothetical protein TNCV_253661 [Trichonephila clavipes]